MSSPARTYRTRAIVLRTRNLGEADKIVTLLTQEYGKVAAVAKGVRRLKSHIAGHLEFASEIDGGFHRGRNLDVITTAETIRAAFAGLSRPEALATAGLLAELVDGFCEPEMPVPDVYTLLAAALRVVATSSEPARVIPRFELRLLDALGYGPACDVCVRCNLDFDGLAWADLEAGGLACAQCRPRAVSLAFVEEDIESFRGLARPRHAARRAVLHATPAAARAAEAFVNYHLGRAPKANRVLEGIGG